MKFGMQAVFTAIPDQGNQLAQVMLKAAKIVAELEGCELYLVQQSLTDEQKVLVTELWKNADCHKASLSCHSVQQLIAQAKPMLANVEAIPAKLIGGHGI